MLLDLHDGSQPDKFMCGQAHITNIRAALYFHLDNSLQKRMLSLQTDGVTADDVMRNPVGLLPAMPTVGDIQQVLSMRVLPQPPSCLHATRG